MNFRRGPTPLQLVALFPPPNLNFSDRSIPKFKIMQILVHTNLSTNCSFVIFAKNRKFIGPCGIRMEPILRDITAFEFSKYLRVVVLGNIYIAYYVVSIM